MPPSWKRTRQAKGLASQRSAIEQVPGADLSQLNQSRTSAVTEHVPLNLITLR